MTLEMLRTWLPIAAVAIITLGMILAVLGVTAGAFFFPGVFLIGAGLLAAAAAGVLQVIGDDGGD